MLVIINLLSPETFDVTFKLKYDVIALSAIVIAFIFIFLRRSQ